MRIIVAPLEFKGTLTAAEAAGAVASGLRQALPAAEVIEMPMADGGPGTLDAMLRAVRGDLKGVTVKGPLGSEVRARWAVLPEDTAIVETAEAIGLARVWPGVNDAVLASSYGAGELIGAALENGARRVFVGIGGSASSDGGRGLLEALGARFADSDRGLQLDISGLDPMLAEAELIVLSDVRSPLLGVSGASRVYGPQKGASPEQVELLEGRMLRMADACETTFGRVVRDEVGAGAAGGLGFALLLLGAKVLPGAEVVARLLGVDQQLKGADGLVTGEGTLDSQTDAGKGVSVLVDMARSAHVPAYGIFGRIVSGEMAFEFALSLEEQAGSMAGAQANAGEEVKRAATILGRRFQP